MLRVNYTPRKPFLKAVNQVVWVQLLLSQVSPKAMEGKYTCVRACGPNYYEPKFLKRSDSYKIEDSSSPVSRQGPGRQQAGRGGQGFPLHSHSETQVLSILWLPGHTKDANHPGLRVATFQPVKRHKRNRRASDFLLGKRCGSGTRRFHSHSLGENVVWWPRFTARDAGKCSLLLLD